MGDQGNASASGSSSSSLDQLFSDASLGASLTGDQTGADLLSGTSSADLSTLFADAGLGSALLGDSSGLGGAFSTATDPSGSAAASLATNPPADTAGTPAGSDPSGNIGGTQSGGAPQPNAPQRQQTPPASQQKQPESPLAQIAKALGASFGLGAKPTAGGPTGFDPKAAPTAMSEVPRLAAPAAEGAGLGAVAGPLAGAGFLLPFMSTPAETGELPPGYGGSPNQPARPVTPTPQAPGPMDPTILAGGPGAGAAQPPAGQPPAAAAKPDPAPDAAPPAPAAPAPATADLPTRKGPETPEAAPEPPQGVYGPTGGAGGMPAILRDILGLALPLALPMLAMGLMGGRGRGRGGIPPWAMRGMMPFMRGTRNGFVGFRGGFLRPGYYPMRHGGWEFHPGGYHPGWGAALAFAGGGGSSGGGGASGGWGAPTSDGTPPNGGQAGHAANQPGGATSPVDGVPPDVLNEARQIALKTGGDPRAVADFMTKEGFPEHAGEWCGDFAAAVVKASGGTPPSGSAAAGSWAAYGAPRQGQPQPGDVAVIRGQDNRTGMGYTHVTFVDSVNPDGTFVGLGGNQGGGQLKRSVFPIASAVFRVPPANVPATTQDTNIDEFVG